MPTSGAGGTRAAVSVAGGTARAAGQADARPRRASTGEGHAHGSAADAGRLTFPAGAVRGLHSAWPDASLYGGGYA